jgi:ribonuclease BN (tRNA processing enzyme)
MPLRRFAVDAAKKDVYCRNAQSEGKQGVKVTLVPSSVAIEGRDQCQFLSSYLINDTLAIDAGCLGFYGTPENQARVRHVFLSHSHIDHVASLPVFLENVFDTKLSAVTIHAGKEVIDCLRQDLFNGRLWPDFIALTTESTPFLKLEQIEPGRPVELNGLRVLPVPVDHVVPTLGFIIADDATAVVIASDTGPTEELWKQANREPGLKAVFLEATFPNNMIYLAAVAKHLTPEQFGNEARKLRRPARMIAVHIKPRFHAEVVRELLALNLPNLEIGQFGHSYNF